MTSAHANAGQALHAYPWQLTVGPMAFVAPGSYVHRADYGALATRPDQWPQVRSTANSFKFFLGSFNPSVSYPEMRAMASLLETDGIRVAIEVGGLRDYPLVAVPIPKDCAEYTKNLGFNTAKFEFAWLKRWLDVGGKVKILALDHPLHFLRRSAGAPRPVGCIASVSDLVVQLGVYMETMSKDLESAGVSGVEFSLIDTALGYDVNGLDGYSYHSTDGGLFIGDFRSTLSGIVAQAAARGVRFTTYQADHGLEGAEEDYAIRNHKPLPATAATCLAMRASALEPGRFLAVEHEVRALGLKLGVVINANHQCHYALSSLDSPYPGGAWEGFRSASDRTMLWLDTVLRNMNAAPDEFVFQSWFLYPDSVLPETGSSSYMSLVHDMYSRVAPDRVGAGMFRTFRTIYNVSTASPDRYCVFTDWASYLAAGGDPTLSRVSAYGATPSAQWFAGGCP